MSARNNDANKKMFLSTINEYDTIKDFMEKCNSNFLKISQSGGGPAGVQGEEGSQGAPAKPKVPIHAWKKGTEEDGCQYKNEITTQNGFEINEWYEDLSNSIYQNGHLIILENGHVYTLKIDETDNFTLKPNYIISLQTYDPSDVIDGKNAYVHIAYTNNITDFDGFETDQQLRGDELESGDTTTFNLIRTLTDDNVTYSDKPYIGIYTDHINMPSYNPDRYTWVKVQGNTGATGEKGDKGDKGDTPTSTKVEVVGYSLSSDLELNSNEWKEYITDLGTLEPGTYIYMKNKYTWSDGSITYGKTVTMAGTQGIKGETGRVLFYLGSFKDGTLSGDSVLGYLNEYRCDYYIDENDVAWMRTGASESATGHKDGSNDTEFWTESEKVGFLQAGAIHADMINADTFVGSKVIATAVNAAEINANNIKSGKISSTDGKSYFNLDNGEFVLGDDNNGGGALSYINGVLHIGDFQTETDSDIVELLNQMGVLNDKINNIGGKNLLNQTSFHYKYTTGAYSGFTKIYNLEAGKTYIATCGKFENNADGATNEEFNSVCLGIGGTSFTSTEQVVRFGEPFYVNGNNAKFLNIIWCDYGYAKEMIGVDDYAGADTKTEFTQYLDQVMLQEGEVATNFQPSMTEEITHISTEMDSYKYLKSALENDTDIAGGLVALSQIQLRDKVGSDYVVNAGISGVKDDNILMWGGGTYDEAYAAANSNTYETGNGAITTLLKKDGTGKIGAFWIDKDTIKVVTDSQTTIITNKSVEEAAPLQSTKSISTETKEFSVAVSSSSQDQKTYGTTGRYTQIASYDYEVPAGKYNLTGVLNANYCRAGGTIVDGSNSGDVSHSYINGLRIRVVQNGTTLATLTGSMSYSETANYGSSGLQVFKSGSLSTGIINSTTSGFSANSGTITIYIEAIVYGYAKLSGLSGQSHSETEFAFSFILKGLNKYTVIANDGIAVITNSDSQFYVQNDTDELKIIAKGLPTSSNDATTGQLYKSGNYLMIK